MTRRWLSLPCAVGAAALAACSQDTPTTPTPVPSDSPSQTLLTGNVTDEWNGGPLKGAIFTTLPFGEAVNANVQYKRKIEVYLDGGPRNPNSLAAGLNDGLYVFQITDPAGKNLLSRDPARCRVVRIKDGVIQGTVAANSIPGLGATTDKWADAPSEKRGCHVNSSEADGASLAGQHDTNVDTDGGGGYTVQMMPFLDTPNPGGVYKAWITPLKVYVQKAGSITALNAVPAPASKAQTTGNAPDKGFANPSRQNVKTDNFKVLEQPPIIRITKLIDANRDGLRDGDAAYAGTPGWPVAIYEPLPEGDFSSSWKEAPATFAVPFGTGVLACERVLPGYKFSYAYVGDTKVELAAAPPAPAADEQGNPIACVDVPGVTTAATVAVAFGNRPVAQKARISISPSKGTNLVGYDHKLTGKVEVDRDQGAGWENAADNTTITFSKVSGPGTLDAPSCETSGGTGECFVNLKSAEAGVSVVEASSSLEVDGTTLSVKTDGKAPNSAAAEKIWVDAKIEIGQDGTNGIGEPHPFTARVQVKHGDDAWANAPDGLTITFGIVSGPGSLNPPSCQTSGGTGACGTTHVSNVTGTTKVQATAKYTDARTPSGQELALATDGTRANSGPATKVWVDGSVSWRKVDALGQPLGGATFRVRRIADRESKPVSDDPDLSVLDNAGQAGYAGRDVDNRAGFFKVEKLPLGTYCVKETAAPSGFELDAVEQCNVVLALTAPDFVIADAFVNRKPGESLTPGYWKNHKEVADKYLPLFLGNHEVLKTTNGNTTFFAIFAAMNCSSSSAQDAVGCLAGHLLASKLNVANGASTCINPTIADGDNFLITVKYSGPSGKYTLNPTQRSDAIGIKDKLDAYNNNIGCNKK
jgi:hypothetical protein